MPPSGGSPTSGSGTMSVPMKALVLWLSGNSLTSGSLPVAVAMSFPDTASVASLGREKEEDFLIFEC